MSECAVVLRTLNEAAGLRVLLPVLAAQEPEPPRVVAVDSGSTDDTLGILAAAGVETLRLAPEEFSDGLGLERVTEPFAAMLSAHAIPRSRYWLADLLAPMRADPLIAAVGGACNGQIPHLPKQRTDVMLTSPEQYLADPVVGLVNANAAVRMSVWREHRFDEAMIACEDKEWTLRVLRAGHAVCLSTGGDVWHEHEGDSARDLYRRGYREHYAMYGYFPRQSFLWFCVEVFGRPVGWFGRGAGRWVGYTAWRLGQWRGYAAARREHRREARRSDD